MLTSQKVEFWGTSILLHSLFSIKRKERETLEISPLGCCYWLLLRTGLANLFDTGLALRLRLVAAAGMHLLFWWWSPNAPVTMENVSGLVEITHQFLYHTVHFLFINSSFPINTGRDRRRRHWNGRADGVHATFGVMKWWWQWGYIMISTHINCAECCWIKNLRINLRVW